MALSFQRRGATNYYSMPLFFSNGTGTLAVTEYGIKYLIAQCPSFSPSRSIPSLLNDDFVFKSTSSPITNHRHASIPALSYKSKKMRWTFHKYENLLSTFEDLTIVFYTHWFHWFLKFNLGILEISSLIISIVVESTSLSKSGFRITSDRGTSGQVYDMLLVIIKCGKCGWRTLSQTTYLNSYALLCLIGS